MTAVASATSSSVSTSTNASAAAGTGITLTEADVVDAAYSADMAPAYLLETQISANETTIAAYQDMQSLLLSLEDSLSSLSDATDTTNDAFSQRSAELTSSSTSSTVEMTASVQAGTPTGTHQIVVSQIATAERIAGGDVASETSALGYTGTMTLGEENGGSASISITSDMSLTDIENAINSQSTTTGVSAQILEVSSDQYMLVLTAADDNQAIDITDTSGSLSQTLGFVDSNGDYANELQKAQPAILSVDGVSGIERDTNDISDIISGVTLNLTEADPKATVTMTIANDTSSAESAIGSFVTAYNNWRDFVIQNQATQSDGTADSSATLFGDSILRDANSQIEDALSSLTDGNSLAAFGITFDENDDLVIDQTTLESALEDNFTAVQSLFDYSASTTSGNLIVTSHADSSYSGSFTLDVTTGSNGIASVSVDGNSSLFTISGDLITGAEGSAYAGLTFYYAGSGSASIGVTVSQGIGSAIAQLADNYANTLNGTVQNEISSMETQDTNWTSEVNDITSQAATYQSYLLDQYATLETQMSDANTTMNLLNELMTSN